MSTSTTISGTVKTMSGEAVPGVEITSKGEAKEDNKTTVSDDNGEFSIPDLTSEKHLILALKPGFMDWKRAVTVTKDQDTIVNITMYSESDL